MTEYRVGLRLGQDVESTPRSIGLAPEHAGEICASLPP